METVTASGNPASIDTTGHLEKIQMPNQEIPYLPISSIAEVLYCPRNFYYRMVEGAVESNYHLLEGKLQEERRNLRGRLAREDSVQIRSVMVSSEALGIIGVVDAVEERGELYPVEYKKGPLRERVNDEVQLCAQAMALEEMLGRDISRGFLYYAESKSRREVIFSEDLRSLVEIAVQQARQIIEGGEIPSPVGDSRCNGCSLAPRCLPQEVKYLRGEGKLPVRPLPALNHGRVLYVDRQGASVNKKLGRIVVSSGGEIIMDMPLCNIDQVVLAGGVNLTTPVAKALLDSGRSVALLTGRGTLRGFLEPPVSKNSTLRLAQFSTYFSQPQRLGLARQFVQGKLANMRTFIMRQNRKLRNDELGGAAKKLGAWIRAAAGAGDLPSLLGIEGMGSREYFGALSKIIGAAMTFDFERRSRRPPKDPVNAMLGLGYSLLVKDMKSALEVVGFDPYVGFYHEAKYGRPALALDLVEEFRVPVVDSVVVSMISRGIIGSQDFEYKYGGCFLNEPGRHKFFRYYEERKRQEIEHPVFRYRLPYLRIFDLQARYLAKVIQGELPGYRPFMYR